MSTRLTREQLKGLTAEEKLAYQKKLNAERVANYREKNKENTRVYNKEYKKIISIDQRTERDLKN